MTEAYICNECDYKWKSRKSSFGKPAFCPSCRSRKIMPLEIDTEEADGSPLSGVKGLIEGIKTLFGTPGNGCEYCGKEFTDSTTYVCQHCKTLLCKKCVILCKKCNKNFCPDGFRNHRCNDITLRVS